MFLVIQMDFELQNKLDELYNFLVEANIDIVSEDGTDDASGEEITSQLA